MEDNEQQSDLSRELEKADRRIRVDRLKREAEEISGGEMVAWSDGEDEDSPIVEEFWEHVVAFEKAPRGTRFAQLQEAGVALPPPDSMTDIELHKKLWDVIRKLAELRVFLYRTDHLSDRELYTTLWDDLLRQETVIMPPHPDSACHLDIIGSGSEEDIRIGLTYYDDDDERTQTSCVNMLTMNFDTSDSAACCRASISRSKRAMRFLWSEFFVGSLNLLNLIARGSISSFGSTRRKTQEFPPRPPPFKQSRK